MATILTRFIGSNGVTVWMPQYDPVDPQDTGGYTSHTLPLSGGGIYDVDDDRPPRGLRKVTRRGVLRENSKRELQGAYEALAVAAGTKGKLYRQTETGDRADWITARLMVDIEDRTPQITRQDDGRWVLATTITLDLQDKAWHGVRHGTALVPLDSGYSLDVGIPLDDAADTTTLDTSPKTITITNDGNMPCDQITLDLLAGSADVTAFSYQCGKANCTFTGLVKAGNRLSIDTANAKVMNQTALTAPVVAGATALPVANAAGTGYAAGGIVEVVLDDGTVWWGTIASLTGTTTINLVTAISGAAAAGRTVSASGYSGFARVPVLHRIAPWLELLPGANAVVTTITGGSTNSQITFSFFDSWA
jgi:hypothetical protein